MKAQIDAEFDVPAAPALDRIAFLNTILASSIDYSIVALDLAGVILAWNEGAHRLYGYAEEEVLGKGSDLILDAAEDVESGHARAVLAETLVAGKWVGTLRRVKKDGTPFITHATMTLRRSGAGEAIGFTMISRSLTEPERLAWDLQNSERDNVDLTEKLHESKEMFQTLTEVAHQVLFVVSADRKTMRYASPSYAAVWGRSVESLYKDPQSWLDAVHPQDRERVSAELSKRADGRLDFQYRIVRGDGATRWILSRSGAIKDGSGRTKSLCGLAIDITDLKEAQLDVVTSELKYRRLFESAKDGILILDAASGAIVDVNPFMLNLLGYSAEDCRGKKLWDIGFFKDVADSKSLFRDLQATGYVRYDDIPLKTKDGRAAQVEFVSNLYNVGGGSVIQCNVRDITERKRAEARLRRLASIIESSDECILGTDLDGVIQSWNRASERLLGYRADEIIGRHVALLCPPNLLEAQSQRMKELLAGKSVPACETLRVGKDGKPREVSFSLSLVKDGEGSPTGFSGFFRDIAQKNQLETRLRQSQKMEGIGRLAGGIAHDFNNLLTGIMGHSEFLMEKLPAGDPRRDDAAEILRSGIRAAALTRQLLAFSRQQALTTLVLDVNAGVAELDKLLRRIIGEHIVLTFIPGADLGRVRTAAGQIEQIVVNLCVNSKDAMEDGGKLLIETANVELGPDYVATHPRIKPGRYVLLAVSDTGRGMDADVQSHLFEPFFTTKEQGKGTGLGLSTVYGIVHQSGGSIDVYSEVGRGTTFKIYLPRVDEPLAASPDAAPARASYRGSETILLVEDDETVRRFVARVLTANGYAALVAATPREAVALCEQNADSIRLLLTDVVMPEMLGYELSRRLEKSMPDMKVVYMSGYTEQSIIQRAALRGASFIQKPMTPDAIVRQIRQALDAPAPPKP
jgi:two-component system cell cycle sensor histidine kinase/response regulator CckA